MDQPTLTDDEVDTTKHRAEREGRQAVIARKLSAGSRIDYGSWTDAMLAGPFRTCRRQGRSILGGPRCDAVVRATRWSSTRPRLRSLPSGETETRLKL